MQALAVYDGEPLRCIGFILPRGKSNVEAFDADDRSLGLFPTQRAAADAVCKGGKRWVMSGQIPTVPCTLMSIMRHINFRQGLEDVRAGRPPRFDNFFDDPWAYERGRQFGYVAPISMRLFINGRII